ncbi:MAG: hypothetical protein NVS1B13_11470 [Flavisolibacter sp.]
MWQLRREEKIYHTLRIAVATCFIGHGTFGIITKSIWCNYFAVFGISTELAYQLMPLVGTIDILVGLAMLLYPVRAIPAWLILWGFATALLRPLSGEPFAEFIERAGNFGAPLALLILVGFEGMNIKSWFKPIRYVKQFIARSLHILTICLQIVVFLLLAGHGWLNLIEKKGLINQYAALGFSNSSVTAQLIGLIEIIAAFTVLIRPIRPLIFGLFLWKMASELFYPHLELFEFLERGGSYGALLALWLVLPKIRKRIMAPIVL